jgi:hypothetical protein
VNTSCIDNQSGVDEKCRRRVRDTNDASTTLSSIWKRHLQSWFYIQVVKSLVFVLIPGCAVGRHYSPFLYNDSLDTYADFLPVSTRVKPQSSCIQQFQESGSKMDLKV